MKRRENDNQVDEMLARHLQREPARFDYESWAEKFPDEARLAATGFPAAQSQPRISFAQIGRYIMTSRYTKYVTAVAVLLVALSFLFPGGNGIVPESIAWADVQKALAEQEQVRITGTRNCFFGDDDTPTYKLGVEKLFSLSYGYADRTFTEDGKLIIEFTYHLPSDTVTVVFPTVKKYYRMEVSSAYRDQAGQVTPEDYFEWLFEWFWTSGDYRQIGPRNVQGIEAIGFEATDVHDRFLKGLGINPKIANFFFSAQSLSVRMWVDPKKRLPIQIEGEGRINPCLITGYRKMKLREINDCWEFGAILDESRFQPQIPEDYEQLGLPETAT